MKLSKFSFSRIGLLVVAISVISSVSATENSSVPTNVVVSGAIVETVINFHPSMAHGVEATFFDTMSGDLSGTGIINIFSGEQEGENVHNVVGTRIWNLAEGHLFTSEVGENLAGAATVHATVTGGTGIYKGATGNLLLLGVHLPDRVEFTYSGTLVLFK